MIDDFIVIDEGRGLRDLIINDEEFTKRFHRAIGNLIRKEWFDNLEKWK